MHQYQQEAIAAERVAARRREAGARRQRQVAKRIRRRPWFWRRRIRRADDLGTVVPMTAPSQVQMLAPETERRAS